jgi:monofunctional biosynthetic peptidoglycan transglycosylase
MAASPASRRSLPARLARIALGLAAAIALVLLALLVAYRFVPPVSTLMLARWATLRPVQRVWVPLEKISPNLVAAVVMSEDARFCVHHGVDWDALQEVIADADEDGPSRGASTIPMQTAKNLFLWPSRSAIRKGLELPLALGIDAGWPKRRIVEVYLNIAEWGPDGVFGAEAAAQRSFGKPAAALSPREAALLATALPNPIKRDAARPGRGHARLAGIVQRRMADADEWLKCIRP